MPFKKYMLTGLMVWLPLAITIWVLSWLVKSLDGVLGGVLFGIAAVAPASMAPAIERLGSIPGLGVLIVAAFMLITGALVSNVGVATGCVETVLRSGSKQEKAQYGAPRAPEKAPFEGSLLSRGQPETQEGNPNHQSKQP